MIPRHRNHVIAVLLLGLIVALVIGALTRRNAPVLIWFGVIGAVLSFEIGREWLVVTKALRKRHSTEGRHIQIPLFLIGSYPYAAGFTVIAIFTYCVIKLMSGHSLNSSESRVLGKIVIYALAPIFIGGFFMSFLRLGRKRAPNRK